MRKAYVAAGLAVALVAGLLAASRFIGTPVSSLQLAPRDLVRTVVATGRVEAPHRVELGAQMVASVVAVPVAEGQSVRAGEILIQLEADELSAAAHRACGGARVDARAPARRTARLVRRRALAARCRALVGRRAPVL